MKVLTLVTKVSSVFALAFLPDMVRVLLSYKANLQSTYMNDYVDHQLTQVYNENAFWQRFYLKSLDEKNFKDMRRISNAIAKMKDELIPTHVVAY